MRRRAASCSNTSASAHTFERLATSKSGAPGWTEAPGTTLRAVTKPSAVERTGTLSETFPARRQRVDLGPRDAQQLQPPARVDRQSALRGRVVLGGGRLARRRRLRVPASCRQVLLLGAEDVRAVDRREDLSALHVPPRLGDEQLLDPPREPHGDHGEAALVGGDDARRSPSASPRLARSTLAVRIPMSWIRSGVRSISDRPGKGEAVGLGLAVPAFGFGTSDMPQMGHSPGWSWTTAGCIGQV